MRRSAGAGRHGRALRCLISFPLLLAFLALHLAFCSFAVDQSQPYGHQLAAHAMEGDHGQSPEAPGGDCDHQQHDGATGEVCLAVPRPSHPLAAGIYALPAVLTVPPLEVAHVRTAPPGPRAGSVSGEPLAGRHLLISVGVART
ncbi:MAG: hypothetical protein ABR608_04260 [Pseudonocardiaceae bacterium]